MENQIQPYISFVAASRNDGHGGNIFKRMQLFVRGLIEQSERHRLPAELILVEWNPPADRPRLRDVLPAPPEGSMLRIRYIEVPPDIHNRYRRAKAIPLFQMIAKNVGIRRAKGKFVLCTNVDLLFSDALFRTLATQSLETNTFYRANRCDVPDELDPAWTIDRQLDWCSKHIIRRIGRESRYANINLEHFEFNGKSRLKKIVANQASLILKAMWPPEKWQYYQMDTFACGDFTLLSRDAWMDIQGYVELDLYSIHIDSLALMAAAALGYRQHVFPPELCTYHIDHPSGWESMSPMEKLKFLEERPGIDYGMLYEAGMYILKHQKRLNLNPEDWGFAGLNFEETEGSIA